MGYVMWGITSLKMDELEKILDHMKCLEYELSAEKVVVAADGHYEDDVELHGAHSSGGTYREVPCRKFVEEVPAVMAPDSERREVARKELMGISENSPYEEARNTARNLLGIKKVEEVKEVVEEPDDRRDPNEGEDYHQWGYSRNH